MNDGLANEELEKDNWRRMRDSFGEWAEDDAGKRRSACRVSDADTYCSTDNVRCLVHALRGAALVPWRWRRGDGDVAISMAMW